MNAVLTEFGGKQSLVAFWPFVHTPMSFLGPESAYV